MVWTGQSGSGYGLMGGSCDTDNEPLGSIKDGKFLYYFSNYQFLKMDSAAQIVILLPHNSVHLLYYNLLKKMKSIMLGCDQIANIHTNIS
jgi:hypothetical protein